jgi:diguanylate cyclase
MFEKHSRTDALTGLHNRRHLDENLDRRTTELKDGACTFSLLILDVDHFKLFNDTHGHLGGDQVLIALGRLLRETMRKEDILTRYGGEEFAVILPGMCIDEAEKVAERLRTVVSSTEVRGNEGEILPSVTVSIGLAQAVPGQDPASVIAAADAALYAAKESGRNRTCRFDRLDRC